MAADWRESREYRVWRAQVIKRDQRCQICGRIDARHAHHVNHATFFPEQRFDPDNGICLCDECHMNFHCNYKRSYRTKCTTYDLDNFRCLMDYLFEVFKRNQENGME